MNRKSAVGKLCLALDGLSIYYAEGVLEQFAGLVGTIKFNSAFLRYHQKVIIAAKSLGYKTWIDLKIHDVPDTAKENIETLGEMGTNYATIHLAGGSRMIAAAVAAAQKYDSLKILGVTLLTSISENELNEELGIPGTVSGYVQHLAMLGKQFGIDGIVCPGEEIALMRRLCGPEFLVAVPGIRFAGANTGPHSRVVTPGYAAGQGADLIVMGEGLLSGGVDAAQRAIAEIMNAC